MTEWPKDRPIRFEYQTRGAEPQVGWLGNGNNPPEIWGFPGLVEGLEDLMGVWAPVKKSSNKMKKGIDFR